MVFPLKERLQIEGLMPERALLRLRRAHIPLYDVEKTEKNKLLVCVRKKDCQKVRAIYPDGRYATGEYTPYTVKRIGAVGLLRVFENAKKRIGFLLGILLFCLCTLYADGFVFGVDLVGSSVYARETYAALEENGITAFSRYTEGKAEEICARLLALDGVEFCSVQKTGLRVRVEIRLLKSEKKAFESGEMTASHTGEIIAMTVLRGTPLKKVGDSVLAGESLVGDWFETEDKGQVRVELIARVRIACTYEAEIEAENEEEAFWKAYLLLGLRDEDTVIGKKFEKTENGYFVTLRYEAIESKNM